MLLLKLRIFAWLRIALISESINMEKNKYSVQIASSKAARISSEVLQILLKSQELHQLMFFRHLTKINFPT